MEGLRPAERNGFATVRPMSTGPEAMRAAMHRYTAALLDAYADASAPLAPGDRARLPLYRADEVTVLAVGTRFLHLVATADPLPVPTGVEIAEAGSASSTAGAFSWQLRFFDPVVVPALGLIDEQAGPEPGAVRATLGVRTCLFHLTVPPGAGLTAHHAQHAGTGLAHAHAAAERDFDHLRALAPDRIAIVDEMHGAQTAGLPLALRALARELAPSVSQTDVMTDAELRRAVITCLRGM